MKLATVKKLKKFGFETVCRYSLYKYTNNNIICEYNGISHSFTLYKNPQKKKHNQNLQQEIDNKTNCKCSKNLTIP